MNRPLLILLCIIFIHPISSARAVDNYEANANSSERKVGSLQAAKEINASKSYKPPVFRPHPARGIKSSSLISAPFHRKGSLTPNSPLPKSKQ